ncbi:MAG: hypothetical protein HP490_07830 [Nitrospira sp.]|nr:hypothetical protein [Nitrospira sp.]
MTRIPRKVVEEIGYYVYAYVNPSTGRISYVGKGKGQRALAHLLRLSGHRVDLLAHGIPRESTALQIEAAVIDALELKNLTNKVRGMRVDCLGRSPLAEVIARYAATPTAIDHPSLLIRISQLFRPGMSCRELYEATRGVWALGENRELVHYALAVANGVVREVYAIKSWHRAGTTNYRTRSKREVSVAKRWEFIGAIAESRVRKRYLGRSVEHLLPGGSKNPIRYVL